MNQSPQKILLVLLLLSLRAHFASAQAHADQLNTRITGTDAGSNCEEVVAGVIRYYAGYPLISSPWGRGVPIIKHLTGELYLYDAHTKKITHFVTIKAPERWAQDTARFSINPRLSSDNRLSFTLQGCPKDNQNCAEVKYFKVGNNGEIFEQEQFDLAAEQKETASPKTCMTYLTYKDDMTFVSIGPQGGPWKALLGFQPDSSTPFVTPQTLLKKRPGGKTTREKPILKIPESTDSTKQ